MTKEQEEAIELLIQYKNDELFGIAGRKALEIVLNMLKEKDADIAEYKNIIEAGIINDAKDELVEEKNKEIKKKEKMIDLILDFIYDIWCVCPVTTTHELDVYDFNVNQCADCEHLDKKCKSCLKQHFERKAEEN